MFLWVNFNFEEVRKENMEMPFFEKEGNMELFK
jgi:hypothetical protein